MTLLSESRDLMLHVRLEAVYVTLSYDRRSNRLTAKTEVRGTSYATIRGASMRVSSLPAGNAPSRSRAASADESEASPVG
jgi:hypothetical protein